MGGGAIVTARKVVEFRPVNRLHIGRTRLIAQRQATVAVSAPAGAISWVPLYDCPPFIIRSAPRFFCSVFLGLAVRGEGGRPLNPLKRDSGFVCGGLCRRRSATLKTAPER